MGKTRLRFSWDLVSWFHGVSIFTLVYGNSVATQSRELIDIGVLVFNAKNTKMISKVLILEAGVF